jgi:ammonium transporter Rh
VLVAFGAVLGRVGPLELLVMSVVQVIGYTLDEIVIYRILGMYDAGGSTVIHLFGAYFGMTVSYILGRFLPAR